MNDKAKKSGIPSTSSLRNAIGKHRVKIIATLVDLLDSRMPAVRMGAAKVLLSKLVPDLKATELRTPDGTPLGIVILPGLNATTNNMDTPQGTTDPSPAKN